MADKIKLTMEQRRIMEELRRVGDAGLSRSCTNSSLCALERRGLAEWWMVDPTRILSQTRWKLTEAGKAWTP